MVLKVVRGKILETLELQRVTAARGSILEPRGNWAQEPFGAIGMVLAQGGLRP